MSYYLDEYGSLHVLVDGNEVWCEYVGFNYSDQALHDLAYEICEEYGYL